MVEAALPSETSVHFYKTTALTSRKTVVVIILKLEFNFSHPDVFI